MFSLATKEDIPQLKKIWTACFGDEAAYQDLFFHNRFCPENTVLWRENGIPVAMAHLLPYHMMDETKESHLCYYVYAVATSPEFQGKGISTKLLTYAKEIAQERGAAALSLVPAEPSLFDFYQKRGYHTEYYVKQLSVSQEEFTKVDPIRFKICTVQTLESLRNSYYGNAPYFVQWGNDALQYILMESAYVGRECLSFCGTHPGYVFCEQQGESLFVREIVCEKEDFPRMVAALFCRYPKSKKVRLRLKADSVLGQGEILPFGMICDLSHTSMIEHTKQKSVPYMGLMLD